MIWIIPVESPPTIDREYLNNANCGNKVAAQVLASLIDYFEIQDVDWLPVSRAVCIFQIVAICRSRSVGRDP